MSQENFNVVPDNPQMDYNRLDAITATAGARIGANILDSLIQIICTIPIIIIYLPKIMDEISKALNSGATPYFNLPDLGWGVLVYGAILVTILSFIVPLLTKGKTLGKAIVGLRIISKNGDYATWMQLFVRSLIYIIPALVASLTIINRIVAYTTDIIWLLSFVFIFTDRYHQAIHDKMANTIVVYDNQFMNRNYHV